MKHKYIQKNQTKITNYFKKNIKDFIHAYKDAPDLKDVVKLLKTQFGSKILQIINTLIWYHAQENDIKIFNDNNQIVKYNNILKGIVLLTNSVINNNHNNIFCYEYNEEENTFSWQELNLPLSDYETLLPSANIIYSLVYDFYVFLKTKINFVELYYLVLRIILLVLLWAKLWTHKKKKNMAFDEKITLKYLEIIKVVRVQLQLLFKYCYNDLIYLINL